MQIVFYTDNPASDYSQKNENIFPSAPERCPFADCAMPVNLEKHGYYERFFISKDFSGILFIRRYICPVCGRTVSMLPFFCIQYFQYSAIDILDILYEFYTSGISIEKLIKKTRCALPTMQRRHINHYRKRLIMNRDLIQYGLNLISPGFIPAGEIPENQQWAKIFLKKVYSIHPHVFLVNFSNITGKSFMAS